MPTLETTAAPAPVLALALMLTPFLTSAALQDEDYTPYVAEASDEGLEALQSFAIPEGFVLELFAAEPLLANPACFWPANNGDFYVAETFRLHTGVTDVRVHPDWLEDDLASSTVADRLALLKRFEEDRLQELYGREHERIKLLRDGDGDGRADWSVVYADGFNGPIDGLGAGLLEEQGSIYYTCIPNLWKLVDGDGDDRAEQRSVLSSGYGVHVGTIGHDLSGLRLGPDGKLYFTCGDRGFTVRTENDVFTHPDTGAVLRCNLDGSELEVVHLGLQNPRELAFDRYGNLFTGDGNSEGGSEARWVQVLEGADSGWRSSFQWIEGTNSLGPWLREGLGKPHFDGQAAYLLPPIANLGDRPAGLTCYPGTGLPPGYDGYFFLADFRGDTTGGIHAFALESRGASFSLSTPGRLVWGALATDVEFGTDGAIYFTDWAHGPDKSGKGRIYRLYYPEFRDTPTVAETRRVLAEPFGEVPVPDVAALLAHADQRVRQKAQFELVQRGEEGWEALKTAVNSSSSNLARIHGAWGLGMAARVNSEILDVLHPFLKDPQPELRAQVARVLGDHRYAPAVTGLIKALGDGSAQVRLRAAIACARIGDARATEPLFALARAVAQEDPALRQAAIYGLEGCASEEQLALATRDSSVHARLAAVVALRRKASPAVIPFLADPNPQVVLEAARAIHDVPIEAGLPALADRINAENLAGGALVRRVLNANLRVGGPERASVMAAFAIGEHPDPLLRADALRLLAQWGQPDPRDDVTGAWSPLPERATEFMPELVMQLSSSGILQAPTEVLERWIDLTTTYSVKEAGEILSEVVADRAVAGSARRRALFALEALADPRFAPALRTALFAADLDLRTAALEALQRIDFAAARPLFQRVLAKGMIAERRTAYQALAQIEDRHSEELLREEFAKLQARTLPEELQLDLLEAMSARASGGMKELAAEYRGARLEADPVLGRWAHSLFGGDAEQGERLFRARTELGCLHCHPESEGAAATIGPDLEGVGGRLARRQLCAAIVSPSSLVAPGYEAVVLTLEGDRRVSGRVLDDGAERLTLLTPEGEEVQIEVDEILVRDAGSSSMPASLGELLSRREMRDLIEYLSSR